MDTYQDRLRRTHTTHEKSLEVFLENSIQLPQDAPTEAQKAELQSDSYNFIKRMLELAREHCEREGLKPGSEEAMSAFEEAHEVATALIYSYEGFSYSERAQKAYEPEQVLHKLALLVPSYVTSLVDHVKKHGKLGVQQDQLSHCTGDYVKGRFKAPDTDRVYALALTQVEIVAYMDEMLWKNPITNSSRLENARPAGVLKVTWNVMKMILALWALSLGVAAIPILLPSLSLITTLGIGLGLVGSVVLLGLLALTIVDIMRRGPERYKFQKSILDMMHRMETFFHEFKVSGPISTAYFRKRVNDLAEAGVIWPSGLFVLLDDMESRGVRMF